jgi:hypothetical protein
MIEWDEEKGEKGIEMEKERKNKNIWKIKYWIYGAATLLLFLNTEKVTVRAEGEERLSAYEKDVRTEESEKQEDREYGGTAAGSTLLAGIGLTTDFPVSIPEGESATDPETTSDREGLETLSNTGTADSETESGDSDGTEEKKRRTEEGEVVASPAKTGDGFTPWPLFLMEILSGLILAGSVIRKKQIQ